MIEQSVSFICNNYLDYVKHLKISKLIIGIHFTVVELSDGSCGLASADDRLFDECCKGRRIYGEFSPGNIKGRSVIDVLLYDNIDKRICNSLKLAIINAISLSRLNFSNFKKIESDPIDLLNIKSEHKVTIVGAFHSYIERISKVSSNLSVVELNESSLKKEHQRFYVNYSNSKGVIANSDILIVTGSTIVNDTLNDILSVANNDTNIVVVGPSGNLPHSLLFDKGVNIIGGIFIKNVNEVFDIISEGGTGYHLFQNAAKKVCVLNDND